MCTGCKCISSHMSRNYHLARRVLTMKNGSFKHPGCRAVAVSCKKKKKRLSSVRSVLRFGSSNHVKSPPQKKKKKKHSFSEKKRPQGGLIKRIYIGIWGWSSCHEQLFFPTFPPQYCILFCGNKAYYYYYYYSQGTFAGWWWNHEKDYDGQENWW